MLMWQMSEGVATALCESPSWTSGIMRAKWVAPLPAS